jgi:hypothetical protein
MCRWLPALATAFSLFAQSVEGPEFEVASLKKVNGIPNPFEDLHGRGHHHQQRCHWTTRMNSGWHWFSGSQKIE